MIEGELDWDEVIAQTTALARTAEAQCGARVKSWRRNTAGWNPLTVGALFGR